MKLFALLALVLLAPLTPSPEWAAWDCESPATVIVAWYDPPQGTGAMTDGLLYVWGDGDTEVLHYRGWYTDVLGRIVHEWYATYDRPADDFYLDAYVRNINGNYFWMPETFAPSCRTYLPMLTGG